MKQDRVQKLTVYSIAYKIFMHMRVTKHSEIVLACTPISQATFVRHAPILHSQMEVGNQDVSHYYWIYKTNRGEFKCGHESEYVTKDITQKAESNTQSILLYRISNALAFSSINQVKITDIPYNCLSWCLKYVAFDPPSLHWLLVIWSLRSDVC